MENEDLFRTLLSLAPSGIYLCDTKGNCQYANPRWCEMAGLSLKESLGDGWAKGLHPEDRDYVLLNWQQMVESEGKWGLEYRFQTPAGKTTWVYGLAVPQRNAMGNIIAYIGINTDITERKHAEDNLLQMAERLNLAQQVANAGVWDWNIETGHIEWSTQMFDLFGLDPLKNRASFEIWKNILHPQDIEIAGNRIDQALKMQTNLDSDYRIVLPDGQIRWINAVGQGKYNEQGRPVRMIGFCMDITERKRVEEALLIAQQQLKLILDTVPALIWQKDCQGRYLQVNNAYCQTVGLSENDIQGKTDYEIFPKEIAEKYVGDDRKILDSGISEFGIEEQHQKPSGKRGWSYTNKMVYCDHGHPTGTIGFALDITERKKVEADLTAAYTNLEILWSVASMADADVKAISDHILASITRMSDSQYGFYGFVNEDESVMTIHTWSGEAMKDCAMADKPQQFPVCKSGIWAEALRHRKPLILNDYHAALTGKKGLPEGHVPLTNLLVVPFFVHGRITAVAAVANKINDYGQEDVNQITAFLGSVQTIVERKRAEEALRESEERFKQLFDHMADGVVVYQAVEEGHNFVLVDMNSPGQFFSRIRLDEALGRRVTEVFPSVERIGLLEVFRRVWRTGHPEHHPLTEYVDGRVRQWVENYVYKLPSGLIVAIYTDTSEKHLADMALRESEERLRTILKSAMDGFWILDTQGRILEVNKTCCQMSGYSEEELLTMCISDLEVIESADSIAAHIQKIIASGEDRFESRHRSKYGSIFDVEVSVQYRHIEGGRFVCFLRDITERKKAEEALLISETRLRTLVETIPDLIWLKDIEGVFLDCNVMFERLFGAAKKDIIGKTDYDFVDRELADFFRENDRKAIAAGKPCSNEEWLTFADNGYRGLFDTIKTPMVDVDGNLLGVLGIARDITNLKRAEQDYKKLFNEMLDGLALHEIICNEAGNPTDYRFLAVNPAFERMTGLKAEAIVGKTVLKVMPGTERHWIETYGKVALTGEPVYFKNYSSELKKHFQVTAFQSAPNQFACIFADITERVQAEEEKIKLEARLLQAQKMESIGSLAGGIAHDLNNILFPISGLSEMLLDEIQPDNHSYESLEQILKSAQRGSELVKQILAFSRQSNPQKLPIRIQPILKEVIKLSRATIPMNIEITSLINNDSGMVSADPTQVHQIVMNLITNAYHAVEETGGTINVELKEAEFEKDDALKPGKYAHITVSDTGTGIDQALIDKIFDPYFTTKEMGKGTGLGLSVVHGIVKEHGGDIQVYSEIGKGTTFNVYLPLLEDAKDSKFAVAKKKHPIGCERILLVDDEEPILRMEQMILERLGYQVTSRNNSADALAAFKDNPGSFDLVISDRGMPNMTGDQLAGELISIRPGVPIILCTGFSSENDAKRAKAMGIKGFLMKPVATGDLAEMVRKVLDMEH